MTGVCSALGASLLTTPAQALEGSDWQHALRVVRDLRASPPDPPVVLLLGGSCARETTVSNKDWAADVQRRSGSPVVTFNLGSRNQTFEQDVALVKALPKIPMLIVIGVNRGRFTSPPKTTTSTTPVTAKGDYSQHHYSSARIQTLERKQKLVLYWMRQRYPVFTERYAANLAQLDKLIALCKQRGYHPVVLDLPRNMEVIGDAFDAPIRQYQDGCRDLAAQHAVPFIDFVDDAQFANDDFFDLDHLVDPGRPKFQGQLADETAQLLVRYGLSAAGEGDSGGALASLANAARSRVVQSFAVVTVLLGVVLPLQRRRVVRRRRARHQKRMATRRPTPARSHSPVPLSAPVSGVDAARRRTSPRTAPAAGRGLPSTEGDGETRPATTAVAPDRQRR